MRQIFLRLENGAQKVSDHDKTTADVIAWLRERVREYRARTAMRNVDAILAGPNKPYKEVGSVEGYLQGVELDGFNRRVAHIRDRVTGESIKCVIPRNAPQVVLDLSNRQIGDVWGRVRVQISGRIFYRGPGDIDYLETEDVRFFRPSAELPPIDDIIDETFTGGLRSEEYLERMRNGTLSN